MPGCALAGGVTLRFMPSILARIEAAGFAADDGAELSPESLLKAADFSAGFAAFFFARLARRVSHQPQAQSGLCAPLRFSVGAGEGVASSGMSEDYRSAALSGDRAQVAKRKKLKR